MKSKKVNRQSHAGKSPYEKEAYNNFLRSNFFLDKTVKDPLNPGKTEVSSFEEDKPEKVPPSKKSMALIVKDFINNNWFVSIVVTVVGGFIIYLATSFISLSINQGIQAKDIEIIKTNQKDVVSFKDAFIAFKVGVSKDIEFIKKKIGY